MLLIKLHIMLIYIVLQYTEKGYVSWSLISLTVILCDMKLTD